MKNVILKLSIFAAILMSCNLGHAQIRLTLEQCRAMAMEYDRDVANARLAELQQQHSLRAMRANYYPKISATTNYIYSTSSLNLGIKGGFLPTFIPNAQTGGLDPNILTIGPDGTPIFKEYAYMPDIDLKLKVNGVFMAGAQLEQPIYMGGKIRSAVNMAKHGLTISKLNQAKTRQDIIEQTDQAYWNCVRVEALEVCANKYRDLVAELYRQIDQTTQSGMTMNNDLLKVKVKLNEAELKCRQAQNGKVLAYMNLCHMIGLPLNSRDMELVDSFDESVSFSQDMLHVDSMSIVRRPEYEMLQEIIELKRRNVKLVRSDFLPQIGAMVNYNYADGLSLNDSKLLYSGSATAGVKLSVPITHWAEGSSKLKAAKCEVQMAENQFAKACELMQLDLMRALNNFDEAILEVELMEESVKQAHLNMEMSANQYGVGMETLTDYLESQVLWQKAEQELVDARAKLRLSYTQFMKASGSL